MFFAVYGLAWRFFTLASNYFVISINGSFTLQQSIFLHCFTAELIKKTKVWLPVGDISLEILVAQQKFLVALGSRAADFSRLAMLVGKMITWDMFIMDDAHLFIFNMVGRLIRDVEFVRERRKMLFIYSAGQRITTPQR